MKTVARLSARYFSGVVMLVSVAAGLFWLAGRWNWVQGWAFLIFFALFVNSLAIWLAKTNPDLYAERRRPAENVEPWDKWVVRCHSLFLLAMIGVAALDSGRFGWSEVPLVVQLVGWVGLFLAGAIIWHVMAINNFLSSWARIQEDRDQVVVTQGAYRWVRHPMYLAVIGSAVCVPLALASYWALIPGLLVTVVIIYRTAREDRMLIDKLSGYAEYKETTRYRLIPGIW